MKNLTKLTATLLLVVMIALIALSGTYAKYTTTVTGKATATVAKFAVGGVTSESFKLFDTIYEEGGAATETVDTDVVAKKIAPGTEGKFAITLTNDSDVTVEYALTFVASNTTLPIKYSLDGQTYKTAAELNATGELAIGSTTQTKADVTVYWKWAFEGDDAADTALGLNPEELTVTASAVFTQVD